MPTVVVRFETCKKAIGYTVRFITVSTKDITDVWNFLPTFTYQLLLGMKPQRQSGESIPKPVSFVLRWKRIFGF